MRWLPSRTLYASDTGASVSLASASSSAPVDLYKIFHLTVNYGITVRWILLRWLPFFNTSLHGWKYSRIEVLRVNDLLHRHQIESLKGYNVRLRMGGLGGGASGGAGEHAPVGDVRFRRWILLRGAVWISWWVVGFGRWYPCGKSRVRSRSTGLGGGSRATVRETHLWLVLCLVFLLTAWKLHATNCFCDLSVEFCLHVSRMCLWFYGVTYCVLRLREILRWQRDVVPLVEDWNFFHTAKETSFFMFSVVGLMIELTCWSLWNHKTSNAIFQDIHLGKRTFESCFFFPMMGMIPEWTLGRERCCPLLEWLDRASPFHDVM